MRRNAIAASDITPIAAPVRAAAVNRE